MRCASTTKLVRPDSPRRPELSCASYICVLNEPDDRLPVMPMRLVRLRDCRPTVPPKVAGPIVAAVPGLRSNTAPPVNGDGKNTHEWCDGSFVSLNGMPSKLIVNCLSEKARKLVLVSPRPGPLLATL